VPVTENADDVRCVGGTRVTLDTVVGAFQSGASAEEIALHYPALSLDDIYAVIAYYLRNRDDVDNYLARRRELAASVRAENEVRFDPVGIRARLLARRAAQAKGFAW